MLIAKQKRTITRRQSICFVWLYWCIALIETWRSPRDSLKQGEGQGADGCTFHADVMWEWKS